MKLDFWEFEEHVGEAWDRLITRAASKSYPQAAVQLTEMNKKLSIMFRAMGGDPGLTLESAAATEHQARRNLLQRIAGNSHKVRLCWRDHSALHLPDSIDVFPDTALNSALYIWLAAMAATDDGATGPWFQRNQQLTILTLHRFPGLAHNYQQLVEAQLAIRPPLQRLPKDEAAQEQAIRQALQAPGKNLELPVASRAPFPVYLWMHPSPPQSDTARPAAADDSPAADGSSEKLEQQGKRSAERSDYQKQEGGLLALRFENIFSWADFIKLDRSEDEEDDLDAAAAAAEDMDMINVAEQRQSLKSRLKFDLDLPSEVNDDLKLGPGILLPEWDFKKQCMKTDYCCLQPMVAQHARACELPVHLARTARRLRNQFEALAPSRRWFNAQQDGSELDLDAYLHFVSQRMAGHGDAAGDMDARLYRELKPAHRDLSCLLLADLSLSTDTWVNNHERIIDVIRDSLYLFAESLSMTGDHFAIHGFSSRNRNHVRFNVLKNFEDHYNAEVRGRIQAIKPGYYTRMGAAIRHAGSILEKQATAQKLLLILTDGKPNDLDAYEGRYGIEDTRMAILQARQQGLQPFCVTIDEQANSYLPHLFGAGHYIVIRKARDLPRELPLLYARLTQ
jgi:nitric oxide reductase NorD protein